MRRLSTVFLMTMALFVPVVGHAESSSVALVPRDGANYDRLLPGGSENRAARERVATSFLAAHADAYDFIVVFTDFPFDFGEAGAAGLFTGVANTVTGTGLPVFDLTSQFGSAGRLQGVIDMGPVSTPHGA